MSNVNELARAAKVDKSKLCELWLAVERLVGYWASRYHSDQGSRTFEFDDLLQSGYLALVDAVEGYASEKGDFIPYLSYHVRSHFREVSGHRTTKRHPELDSFSLDMPLSSDTDTCHVDLLADPVAHLVYADIAERLSQQQDCAALLTEIERLPEQPRQAVTLTTVQGRTLAEAAQIMDVSSERVRQCRDTGLRKVRNTRTARLMRVNYHRHVGLAEFRHTFTSAVEAAVLRGESAERICV